MSNTLEIRRITFYQYLMMLDKSKYNFAIKYSPYFQEPENLLGLPDIDTLEFGYIKDYQTDLENGDLNFITQVSYLTKLIDAKTIEKSYLDEVTKTCSWFLHEITNLLKIENELLSSSLRGDEIYAGIESFQDYGIFPQLLQLANDDITKIEKVRKIKYSDCILFLSYKKHLNEYQFKLNQYHQKK